MAQKSDKMQRIKLIILPLNILSTFHSSSAKDKSIIYFKCSFCGTSTLKSKDGVLTKTDNSIHQKDCPLSMVDIIFSKEDSNLIPQLNMVKCAIFVDYDNIPSIGKIKDECKYKNVLNDINGKAFYFPRVFKTKDGTSPIYLICSGCNERLYQYSYKYDPEKNLEENYKNAKKEVKKDKEKLKKIGKHKEDCILGKYKIAYDTELIEPEYYFNLCLFPFFLDKRCQNYKGDFKSYFKPIVLEFDSTMPNKPFLFSVETVLNSYTIIFDGCKGDEIEGLSEETGEKKKKVSQNANVIKQHLANLYKEMKPFFVSEIYKSIQKQEKFYLKNVKKVDEDISCDLPIVPKIEYKYVDLSSLKYDEDLFKKKKNESDDETNQKSKEKKGEEEKEENEKGNKNQNQEEEKKDSNLSDCTIYNFFDEHDNARTDSVTKSIQKEEPSVSKEGKEKHKKSSNEHDEELEFARVLEEIDRDDDIFNINGAKDFDQNHIDIGNTQNEKTDDFQMDQDSACEFLNKKKCEKSTSILQHQLEALQAKKKPQKKKNDFLSKKHNKEKDDAKTPSLDKVFQSKSKSKQPFLQKNKNKYEEESKQSGVKIKLSNNTLNKNPLSIDLQENNTKKHKSRKDSKKDGSELVGDENAPIIKEEYNVSGSTCINLGIREDSPKKERTREGEKNVLLMKKTGACVIPLKRSAEEEQNIFETLFRIEEDVKVEKFMSFGLNGAKHSSKSLFEILSVLIFNSKIKPEIIEKRIYNEFRLNSHYYEKRINEKIDNYIKQVFSGAIIPCINEIQVFVNIFKCLIVTYMIDNDSDSNKNKVITLIHKKDNFGMDVEQVLNIYFIYIERKEGGYTFYGYNKDAEYLDANDEWLK